MAEGSGREWLRHGRVIAPAVAVATIVLGARVARSAVAFVDAESSLQLYSVRSPWGSPVLSRQRLVHQLGLVAYGTPVEPSDSEVTWSVHARLRLTGDYGISDGEVDPNEPDTYVPGLETSPVDLSYGYVEATGLFRGTSFAALGRQLFWDTLGFWTLDGARFGFAPGHLFELSLYGGIEPRGGGPWLATHRYEADGVQRGNRDDLVAAQWPSYLNQSKLAPAFGGSFALTAVTGLRLVADYRRVENRDRVVTLPFADASGKFYTFSQRRVSSERLGIGIQVAPTQRAEVDGAYIYDWYQRTSEEHRLTVAYRPTKSLRWTAGYRYHLPTFDADSIFNWFGAKGSVTAQSGLTWSPTRAIAVTVSGGVRWLGVGPKRLVVAGLDAGENTGKDGLFQLDSTCQFGRAIVGSSTTLESGDGGKRGGTELSYRQVIWDEQLAFTGTVGGGYWQHPLLLERSEASAQYSAGVLLFPGGSQELATEWEHVIAEGSLQRYRIVATARVRWP